ncbi:hypothetical protein AGABI1DRAFT_134350 [Agaricus bisporus var. burnettii JB137-S8]|uniref:Uncharacterized protein n=1 Tax=Agaricus bisporus var. burnettii (strain JB137-S8 / ATCC MYA-4627 / FGSC 10392) TaxID=597362 RepID=K5WEI5_AGABU|nr:uncharacterized protein AGABI1DRAFT_134350 [Agaricus bisporus var. burnettii JB137-S8]EKM73646.1 hypothetical protein AGABI1DRAFT_134350 [Agaricus bisporus var. burnettii JB137-S8]
MGEGLAGAGADLGHQNSIGTSTIEEEHTGEEGKGVTPSMKRPKLHFYDFSSRFMDDTKAGGG